MDGKRELITGHILSASVLIAAALKAAVEVGDEALATELLRAGGALVAVRQAIEKSRRLDA